MQPWPVAPVFLSYLSSFLLIACLRAATVYHRHYCPYLSTLTNRPTFECAHATLKKKKHCHPEMTQMIFLTPRYYSKQYSETALKALEICQILFASPPAHVLGPRSRSLVSHEPTPPRCHPYFLFSLVFRLHTPRHPSFPRAP